MRVSVSEIRWDNLNAVLDTYGQEVVRKYREKLAAAGKSASGELANTLHYYIERKGDVWTLWLALQDYWKYLERGTRLQGPWHKQGKRPPLAPFVSWVQNKGIPLQGKKVEQVAWAVATKVWKNGTRPFWFLRDSIAELPGIEDRVDEAIKQDLEDWMQDILAELR